MSQPDTPSIPAAGGQEVTSPGIRIHWTGASKLELVEFGAERVPQGQTTDYVWSNAGASVSAGRQGENRVVHEVRAPGGSFEAVWSGGDHIGVTIRARSEEPISGVGIKLALPAGNIRCLGGSVLNWASVPAGERTSFADFPWGVGQAYFLDTGLGCLRFGRQVPRPCDYNFGYLERTAYGWELCWLWQPQLPFPTTFAAQEVQFRFFESLAAAVDDHRQWAEATYRLRTTADSPHVPDWFRGTRLLFQINMGETNGAVVHDYRDVTHLAEDLHAMGVPEGTILYIPDYNPNSQVLRGGTGPVCSCWPENPLLGGVREFARMVKTAQGFGYHILPHGSILLLTEWTSLNFNGADGKPLIWRNPSWQQMKQWAIVNAGGQPIGWPPDEAAGRYPYMARYLNPAFLDVQNYYLEGTSELIRAYDLDCFYFDSVSVGPAISYQGNIPGLPAIIEGERQFIARLYERHPDVLFMGELFDEASVGLVPVWQARNPLSHAMFGRYVYTFAHTVTGSSVPQRYAETGGISNFEERAQSDEVGLSLRQQNNIPRLLINYRDRRLDALTRRYIEELLATRP